jgi:hypothetical protein
MRIARLECESSCGSGRNLACLSGKGETPQGSVLWQEAAGTLWCAVQRLIAPPQ